MKLNDAKTTDVFKLAMVFAVALAVFAAAGCGKASDPFEVIDQLQEMMAEKSAGKGEVIAKVEGREIYKNVFDMQVDLAMKYSGLTPEQQLRERGDLERQKQMLESAVLSQAILEDMRNDPDLMNDPEFIVFINMTLMQGLQQYYMVRNLDTRINHEVTEADISREYDELIQNPQYREQLSRMPKEDVDQLLGRQVLERRRQAAMQRLLLDLQGKYRIARFDDKLTPMEMPEDDNLLSE